MNSRLRAIAFSGLTTKLFTVSLLILIITACGEETSDAGGQSDKDPIASVQTLNFEKDENGLVNVRAGTQVIVSAKDSDGVDDPLISFDWEVTLNGTPIPFTLQSANTVSFMAPSEGIGQYGVAAEDVTVSLTITDSDGASSSTKLAINVMPVLDTNAYLVQNINGVLQEEFFIDIENNNQSRNDAEFTLDVIPVLTYTKLDGSTRTVSGSTVDGKDTLKNIFSTIELKKILTPGETYRYKLALPLLDHDEINAQPGLDAKDRLELQNIDTAELKLNIALKSPSPSFKLTLSFPDQGQKDPLSFDNSNGNIEFSLNTDELRELGNYESQLSAQAYYECIDQGSQNGSATLDDWLTEPKRSFGPLHTIQRGENSAHTIYTNKYDLGFGRDMHMKQDGKNVYSYVANFPNLESTVKCVNDFAVVAMDYSESYSCAVDPETSEKVLKPLNNRTVKFWAFVPDLQNGGYKRALTMNFDGRGERAVPGVCTSCHGGAVTDLQFATEQAGDLNATFMPWDLDSFLYTTASSSQPDPGYNASEVASDLTNSYTRQAQEEQFKQLNQMALSTYISEVEESRVEETRLGESIEEPILSSTPTSKNSTVQVFNDAITDRYLAPIKLINGWYGNQDCEPSTDESSLQNCRDISSGKFDGNYVQPGWDIDDTTREIYKTVYERNCRMCHTQLANTGFNFDTYEEFIGGISEGENVDKIHELVYQKGQMPMARLTADRFWLEQVDYKGEKETAANRLSQHLQDVYGKEPSIPGLAVAVISRDIADNPKSLTPNISTPISFDSSESLFTERVEWAITDQANNTVGSSQESRWQFQPQLPGSYTITLSAYNKNDQATKVSEAVQIYNRLPFFNNDEVHNVSIPSDYQLGSDLTIDIGSLVGSDGDAPAILELVSLTADLSQINAKIDTSALASKREVTVIYPAPPSPIPRPIISPLPTIFPTPPPIVLPTITPIPTFSPTPTPTPTPIILLSAPNLSSSEFFSISNSNLVKVEGHFEIKITDKNGDEDRKILYVNIDPVEQDKEPPSTPIIEQLTLDKNEPNSITLYWQESTDNVGIKNYEVAIGDDTNTLTTEELNYTFENLESGKDYEVTVTAVDTSSRQNKSSSTPYPFTTYTSYKEDVFVILSEKRRNCTSCHGSQGDFTFESDESALYQELKTPNTRVSVNGCSDETPSKFINNSSFGPNNIITCAEKNCGAMIGPEISFTDTNKQTIGNWMCQGSPDN